MPERIMTSEVRVRWKRWAGLLLLAGVLLAALAIGLVWIHYRSTPDFDVYVAENPMDPTFLDERVPVGVLRIGDRSWSAGEIDRDPLEADDEEPPEEARLVLEVELSHGEDRLLRLRQVFSATMDRETSNRGRFSIETPLLETRGDVRAEVLVGIDDLERLVGPESAGRGWATVDVFLVAGGGESRVRILDAARDPFDRGELITSLDLEPTERMDSPLWDLVTGLFRSPPSSGLVHHVEQGIGFSWRLREDGRQSSSLGRTRHEVSTKEYSYALDVRISDSSTGFERTWTRSSVKTWGQEVW